MTKHFFEQHFPIKNALFLFLFFSSFCTGLFNEAFCAATSLVLTTFLCVEIFKNKKIKYSKSLESIILFIIVFCFLLTAIWAVDKLMALVGFLKFFSLILFGILLSSQSAQKRDELLHFVPSAGVIMSIVSAIMTYANIAPQFFSVNNRIAGFFQYPNTFALFLLIGLIVCAMDGEFHKSKPFTMLILLGGIFLSGSRTGFVLTFAAVIAILIISKDKKIKISLGILIAALIAAASIYYLLSGKTDTLSRFFTISASSTTLKGRLIYAKDAIKEALKHPFGLGYMGYYYTQGSFQSALYSNMFVHNELLQMMLDIGWLPAIGFLVAIGKALFNKQKPLYQKLIIAAILLHSLFDFNLQFLVIDFILVICIFDSSTVQELKLKRAAQWSIGIVLGLILLLTAYFSTVSALYTFNQSETAVKICPHYTPAQIECLTQTKDEKEQVEIADTILKNNKHISLAYSVKARQQFTLGEIEAMIQLQKKAISCARYSTNEYNAYYYMLLSAIDLFLQNEDAQSAQYCLNEITSLETLLKDTEASTDAKAYDLPEKPDFKIDPKYRQQYKTYQNLLSQIG